MIFCNRPFLFLFIYLFFLFFFYFFIFFKLHLNENKQPFHMRYHFFLHIGHFLQNLGKEAVRTNMHTTVTMNTKKII